MGVWRLSVGIVGDYPRSMYSRWLSNMERIASYRPSVGCLCAGRAVQEAREHSFACMECGVNVRGRRRKLEDT